MTLVTCGEVQHEDGGTVNMPFKHIRRRRQTSIGQTRFLMLRTFHTSFRGTLPLIVAMCILGIMSPVFGQPAPTRDERITLLRSRITAMSSLSEKVEMERALAYLWLGVGCDDPANNEMFVAETERILQEYKDIGYHYSYLDLKVTYAQLQAAVERESLLWEVILFDPREIQSPAGADSAKLANRLKQGAIWAYLNGAAGDAVGAAPDVQARRFREEAEKLSARLKETEEGRRCEPLASWWRDTLLTDKPMNVPVPVLDAPPPSKWHAAPATELAEPATESAITPELPSTGPTDTRFQRTFDSVEYIGTVIVPEPVPSGSVWLPWGLGSAGIIVLATGLVMVRLKRPAGRKI